MSCGSPVCPAARRREIPPRDSLVRRAKIAVHSLDNLFGNTDTPTLWNFLGILDSKC